MDNIRSLFDVIFFGDFGLMTVTPKYLFLVLLPVMIMVGFLTWFLSKIPRLQRESPGFGELFYCILGLGCTTAALSSLEYVKLPPMRKRLVWLLILVVPCSAQLSTIAAFAAMVRLRLFLVYLAFFTLVCLVLILLIHRLLPCTNQSPFLFQPSKGMGPLSILKDAFLSVIKTAKAFCAGSIIISVATYVGLFQALEKILGPFLESFFQLPKEASSLLLLNIFKRDFGSAALLSVSNQGAFNSLQLVTLMLMMTFTVPCFNSAMILIRSEKLSGALFLWLGSLTISLLTGKLAISILSIFFV